MKKSPSNIRFHKKISPWVGLEPTKRNKKLSESLKNAAPPSQKGGKRARCTSCKRVALNINLMQAPHW